MAGQQVLRGEARPEAGGDPRPLGTDGDPPPPARPSRHLSGKTKGSAVGGRRPVPAPLSAACPFRRFS